MGCLGIEVLLTGVNIRPNDDRKDTNHEEKKVVVMREARVSVLDTGARTATHQLPRQGYVWG
jgi:hypothetical protein